MQFLDQQFVAYWEWWNWIWIQLWCELWNATVQNPLYSKSFNKSKCECFWIHFCCWLWDWLGNFLCVYFFIGNPRDWKKNKQNNNLLIIKNFSKSQTHPKQQLQKHWTLLRFFFSIKYLFCVGLFSNPSGQKIIKTTERRIQTEWNIFYLFHVYLFAHKWDSESSQITRHFL